MGHRRGRTHDRTIHTTRYNQSPWSTHAKRAIADHLCPSDYRLYDVVRIRFIVGGGGASADFHQPREDRGADRVGLSPLTRKAPFYEFDLSWVEGTRELGHESAIESVYRTTRRGRGSVEHSREVVRGFKDMGDRIWGLLGPWVCRRVQLEDFGETLHVFVKDQLRHIGCEVFDGR